MSKKPIKLHRPWWLLATSLLLASCGTFGDDGERFEKLDRLRVLAIRSDPADLSAGETATLSAEVYEPEGRELSYEWSWCPARGDGETGFACTIPEEQLQRAWTAAGLDGDAPAYDLGTESEAQLTHVLTPELVAALCGAPDLDEQIARACFEGLEADIALKVQSSEATLTAIKSVPFLMDAGSEVERNTNPASDFELTVSDNEGDVIVAADRPLQAGHQYKIVASVDEANAETFTPRPDRGEPSPKARRETLVMSWFITVGELADPEGDGSEGIGDDDRGVTTFVEGSNQLEDLLKNGWKIPLTAGSSASLFVVLRDERGGVGFATRSFEVTGGQP